MDIGKLVKGLSENKLKIFLVTSNFTVSGSCLYHALEYASRGQYKSATAFGLGSMLTSYIAGLNSRSEDVK